MNHDPAFALNEPQSRRIAAALTILEKHLAALRDALEHGVRQSRLVRYEDPIAPSEAQRLLPALQEAEHRLRQIADDLALPAGSESVRRSFLAALELDSIHLYECRPRGELAGCGTLAPATAAYLDREIEKLDAAVRTLIALLQRKPPGAE
ncbi:MAG: hypothetical protein WHT82_08395 [Limisphaera sp.]